MRSHRRLLVVAAAMSLLLAGCASIPQSGAVHVSDVKPADDSPELDFLARSPEKGATQEQILRGFIDAAASPANLYQTARKYLTSGFSDEWNPDAGAVIDRDVDRDYTSTGELSMSVDVTPVAGLTAHGQYAETASTPVSLPYEFVRVKGEWRISRAPQGILIDAPTFALVFGAYSLYFFDPSFSALVPDLRYFPRRLTTPTQIVRELIAGPSPWLKGAVVSAFPDGSASETVQVVARDAQVPLNSEALKADQTTLARMKQQLTSSFSGVTTIGDVTLYGNQVAQDVPTLETPSVQQPVDSRALVMRGGAFGFLSAGGDSLEPVRGLSDTIAALSPKAVTLGPGQNTAAVLTPTGVVSVRSGAQPVALDPRPDLIAPTVDAYGVVMSVPSNSPSALTAFASDGTPTPVTTSWPEASSITSLRMSRDGTRVIALLQTQGGPRFFAAAVIRGQGDKRQIPVQLGEPLALATADGTPKDVAWVDELSVASLTTRDDGSSVLVSQQIGGPSVLLDASNGAEQVTGGNTDRDVRLLGSDGILEQRQGNFWQPRIDGVAFLGTQQGL